MPKKQKPDPYTILLESWGERAEKYAENRQKWGSCPECGSALKSVGGYVRCLEFPRCLYKTTQDDALARIREKAMVRETQDTHAPQGRGGVIPDGETRDWSSHPAEDRRNGSRDPDPKPGPDMSFIHREFWSESELARYLNVHVETVRRHRRDGTGPPYLTAYRNIRYAKSAVEAWIKQNLSKPLKK